MTAYVDFAMLPPEVNSARMYSGAGPGPLLAAASAWNGLAAELFTAATSYSSILGELAGQAWLGPASTAMAAAAAPYVAWMSTTAAQAEQTAGQAEAAVAAYEAAFAATVPPPVIAANRAQLMVLIATNFFGQNTAAIAATEAQYAEMWAQDAAAMYGYAGASAVATQLSQFIQPQHITQSSGLAAQSAAVAQAVATPAGTQQTTLSQVMATLPNALHGLASPSSSTGTTGETAVLGLTTGSGPDAAWLWNNFGPDANIWNSIFASGFYMPSNTFGPFLGLLGAQGAGNAVGDAAAQATANALGGAIGGPMSGAGGIGNAVTAGVGRAAMVGPLSVPPSWAVSTPLHSPLSSTLAGAPSTSPSPVTASTPPVPFGMNAGRQGYDRAIPRYGFRPSFVARSPAAG
jgi:PPE-repeat protein